MARQCPRCELRFLTDVEVRDHLIVDHKMEPEQLAQPYPRPSRNRTGSARKAPRDEPADDTRRGR